MTDLEFLVSYKSNLRKKCIYFLDTGLFQFEIKTKVLAQTKNTPCFLSVEEFTRDVQFPPLFGERYFFVTLQEEKEIPLLISGINKVKDERILIFSPLKFSDILDKEKDSFQILQEIKKNKTSFDLIFQYCLQKTAISKEIASSFPALKQNIEELFAKCSDIAEFLNKAEFILFSCLEENNWNTPLFRSLLPHISSPEYFKLHENLFFFLSNPTFSSKEMLFLYFEKEYALDGNSRTLLNSLFRATFDLLEINSNFEQEKQSKNFKIKFITKFSHIPIENILKMMLKLSEYGPDLITQDFLSTLDNFLQNILEYIKE